LTEPNESTIDQRGAEAEVAIVGAGPLGIELAVALQRVGISYIHFDACQIGYTISWFPPQTRFFSSNDRIAIAGVPLQTPDQNKATREQYLAYLRSVVQQFNLKINTHEPVIGIERQSDRFVLTTTSAGVERNYRANRIVLATGGTAHPRTLNVPGENLPHVHQYWRDPHDYFGKRVLVVGGKNSAVETALRFHHAGVQVSLCYRRAELPAKSIKYWLLPEITGLMKSGAIKAHVNTCVTAITPTHVRLSSGENVEADFVVPQIGYVADMSLCRMAGVDLQGDRQTPVYDPRTMETNVPGVYLCGTVIGGTQDKYEIFIENGHVHVERILARLTGRRETVKDVVYANPES
jgi:thioredoxin reductase (NADPH)